MKKADFTPPPCCPKPAIGSFDFRKAGVTWVNRYCARCQTHWYGPERQVKTFTGTEWKHWQNLPDTGENDAAWFAQWDKQP